MITSFKLNTSELNTEFLEAIKKIFRDKDIELTIKIATEKKLYSQKLLDAKENAEVNENTVEYTVDEFEKLANNLK